MNSSLNKIFKEDVEDVYLIIQTEKMKRTNVDDIHRLCTAYRNFNKKSIKKLRIKRYWKDQDKDKYNTSMKQSYMTSVKNIQKNKF